MPSGGRALDLTGEKFGRLTAIRCVGKKPGQGFEWECQCECGGTKIAVTGRLRSGSVRSCGCLRPEVHAAPRENRRKRPYEHLFNRLHSQAAARGIECSLTFVEFLDFVTKDSCSYCGSAVEWAPVSRPRSRLNLDRKDNAVGYVSGNLVVCCWECNDGKGDRYSFEEWTAMSAALIRVRNG